VNAWIASVTDSALNACPRALTRESRAGRPAACVSR
jgi:hypothetical protein